ncbi:MAG: hypothetical protein RIS70_1623 [Planctomycetota bacterium]
MFSPTPDRNRMTARWSRRSFLEVGTALLGPMSLGPISLGLSDLLMARSRADEPNSANTESPRNAASGKRRHKSIIVFWTHGGLSQQDTYDMKPDAPAEFRGPYQAIQTAVPGILLGERFPRQAKMMDKLSIVRSVNHQNGIHAPSAHWMQTGYFGPTLARNAPQKPSFGSVIARAKKVNGDLMPPYVTIPKAEAFGYQGSVYLGAGYNPFELNTDPNAGDFTVPNLSLPKGLAAASVEDRARLLKEFDTLRRDIDRSGSLEGLDGFKRQALELVTGPEVREAFDLAKEPPALRDRYGRHMYGQAALLARRLVEAGSACVTINTGYWDHHDNIEPGLEQHLPPLDAAIATLVEDLDTRGMLQDVVIYCAGEFGRTPLINGHAGRDHWANCFSVLLGGGGLAGGRIVGASEPKGGNVVERPVSPQDLLATIYHALDIPLDTHYPDATGRPVSIVGAGRPLRELS